MATLTPTIKLISAAGQATSDALSFSLSKDLTVVAPSVGLSKITVTTTASDSIIVPSLIFLLKFENLYPTFLFLYNLLNKNGSLGKGYAS